MYRIQSYCTLNSYIPVLFSSHIHPKTYSPFISQQIAFTVFYYIHTEKYSPKSHIVKFHTKMSSSQSEERTMVFTSEKNDTSNQNRERCFFTCEKNDTSNQKSGVWVSREDSRLFLQLGAPCNAASHTFKWQKFPRRVFLVKKVKLNISEIGVE